MEDVVNPLGALGFSGILLMFIACLEMLSAALFLFPRTRSVGLLLVSAYLGGAISTHVGRGESALRPAIVLALFWTGAWLRRLEIIWSRCTGDLVRRLDKDSGASLRAAQQRRGECR